VLGGDLAHQRGALGADAVLEGVALATGAAGAAGAGAAPPVGAAAGAAAAGAGAAAGAPIGALLSVSMRATMVPTATVCPSVTDTSARTPPVGAGISASTLSVEISKIGSSRLTSSPTFLSQRESVPSAMLSPIWGMMTSTRATVSSSVWCGAPEARSGRG
jgi:hypothetical protein